MNIDKKLLSDALVAIDLSHTITMDMPVYPGTEAPIIEQANTIEKDGFTEKKIHFHTHIGTHLDAPAHILPGLATVDELSIDNFVGKALCIPITQPIITTSILQPMYTNLKEVDFVLFATGWSKYWGSDRYFSGYPVLVEESAKYLCSFNLKGVGFDTISADQEDSFFFPIHRILLKKMIIIENLVHLEKLTDKLFFFSCLPLKIEKSDGSPIRAIALSER